MSFVSAAAIGSLAVSGYSLYNAAKAKDTASGVRLPPQFTLPYMNEAAGGAYGGIQGLAGQGVPQQTVPLYQQTAMQQYANPYAQMFMQGAQQGGQMGQQAGQAGFNAGQGAINAGQNFMQAGQSVVPYASQIAQTAFDPQNALYARTQQQLTDQTRAGQAARGVATTPYGAAGESDTLRKFDIDWQNAQLGRQIAGGQGAANVLQSGAGTSNAGVGMVGQGIGQETQGASTYANAAGLPYSAYGQIGQGQFGALNNWQSGVGGAQQIGMTPVEAYLKYLGVGNQAGGVANQQAQVALNQANSSFNQNQAMGANIGSSLAGIAKGIPAAGNAATTGWNWLNNSGTNSSYSPALPGALY